MAGMARREADPEYKRKRAESLRTPEMRALRSKISTEKMADPGVRERISVSTKAAFASEEVRAERRRLRREQWDTPGFKEKHREAMEPVWAAQGDAQREIWEREGYREQQSATQRAVWDDADYRVKRSAEQKARLNNPETKRRMSEARRAWAALKPKKEKPTPKGARANPEYLANHSARAKAQWDNPIFVYGWMYQKARKKYERGNQEFAVMPIPFGWGG